MRVGGTLDQRQAASMLRPAHSMQTEDFLEAAHGLRARLLRGTKAGRHLTYNLATPWPGTLILCMTREKMPQYATQPQLLRQSISSSEEGLRPRRIASSHCRIRQGRCKDMPRSRRAPASTRTPGCQHPGSGVKAVALQAAVWKHIFWRTTARHGDKACVRQCLALCAAG